MSSLAVQDAPPVESVPRSRLGRALIALTFGALWLSLLHQLSGEWSVNEQYSYGWFVPLFAAYLFWLRWQDKPEPRIRNENLESRKQTGFLISTLAFLLFLLLLPLRLFEIGNPDWRPLSWIHAGVVVSLSLLYIGAIGGRPWARHFAFPVCFILFAVPWISPIEEPIVQGLMRGIASAAAELITLFGIPAEVQGNLIRIANGLVGVNEACSGVRSLQTSLMIGLLFGEVRRLSLSRRFALIGGAIAIALVANFLRAFALVWIAATKGLSESQRWHDFAGYAIVVAVFIGTMLLASRLGRGWRTEVGDRRTEVREQKSLTGHKSEVTSHKSQPHSLNHQLSTINSPRAFAAALIWLLAVELTAHGWYWIHERNLLPQPGWTVRWPTDAQGFRNVPISEDVRGTLRYDEGRQAAWSLGPGERCAAFFFRWNPGGGSVLRARAHRPDICLPAAGWRQLGSGDSQSFKVTDSLTLPLRHVAFEDSTGRVYAHTFFCLQEDQIRPNEPRPDLKLAEGVQPDWGIRGRWEAVKDGIRNLGQQVLECVVLSQRQIDDATAREQFAALLPKLIEQQAPR